MTKIRVAAAVAATALAVAGLSAAAATPAAADESWVCITGSPTPQYQGFDGYGGVGHELTHSEGRGFRVYHLYGGSNMATWAFGHGAQYPGNDGWVRYDRLRC